MIKKCLMLLLLCCTQGITLHLKAETITYDFSSPDFWVTESNGTTHPETGTSATIGKIYYVETNACFVGTGNVYFSEGYLMLNKNTPLKLPNNPDWTINKVTIHSHSSNATSAKVNIYNDSDGSLSVSTALTWEKKDSDYEYKVSTTYSKSVLYIVSKNSAARITSITIDYTSTNSSSVSAPTFTPGTSTFSSETLDVTINAAEGCEVYYTTDGSKPSYTDAANYGGTKGYVATISASESPVTLQAIAVDPASGTCSNISSATYTYVDSSDSEEDPGITITNNGSKSKPYTVAEMKAMSYSTTQKEKWVKGTICGTIANNQVVTDNFVSENLALGDATAYVSVQLPAGDIQDAINLKKHPYLQGKELLIKGNIEAYENVLGVKSPTHYEITYDVPINRYGYASLFLDMPVALPEGSTAYYCTTEGNRANLISVGTIIPANVGVIIESIPNTTCTLSYTTEINGDTEIIGSKNQLIGFTEDTEVNDGNAYYALNVKEDKVGFYIPQTTTDGTDATKGFTAKANKAYLKVEAGDKATMFVIQRSNDETEIIPTTRMSDEVIYDLQGRVVSSPATGVYIMGGKKVFIDK